MAGFSDSLHQPTQYLGLEGGEIHPGPHPCQPAQSGTRLAPGLRLGSALIRSFLRTERGPPLSANGAAGPGAECLLFRHGDIRELYFALVEVRFYIHAALRWMTPAARHVARGLKKGRGKSARFPNFIRIEMLLRIIQLESIEREFAQALWPSFYLLGSPRKRFS